MTLGKQRALIIGLIALGILIAGFFGLRSFRAFREFRGHTPAPLLPAAENQQPETDVEPIRDWMTIPFISITYNLPHNLLYEALDIPPRGNEEKSLKQLNEEYFPENPGYVLQTVKDVIPSTTATPTGVP